MERPTFADVLEARKTIAPYVDRTPLHSYPGLSKYVGADVRLKHENHQPLASFKARGGVNLLAHMSQEERSQGLITASSGNHGQSIAYACKLFGARAMIGLPLNANPVKVESMQNLGAEIIFHGKNFDEAREHCERLALEEGYLFVHPANNRHIIAGVGTETLEVLEDFPDVEVVYVPLGGGSGVAGACIVAKAVNPSIKVVAVQSSEASAGYLSWKDRKVIEAPMNTIAEGLATASGYQLTQEILWDLLDDFLLVSDREILQTIAVLIEKAHTLAEGAGATALAGVIKSRDSIKGKKVAAIVSGGNITLEQLREVVNSAEPI